jgi:hypothetical protein
MLEARVYCEIERRAALPWWRLSFAHWPLFARAAFLVMSGVLIGAAFVGGASAIDGLRSLSWAREVAQLCAYDTAQMGKVMAYLN